MQIFRNKELVELRATSQEQTEHRFVRSSRFQRGVPFSQVWGCCGYVVKERVGSNDVCSMFSGVHAMA